MLILSFLLYLHVKYTILIFVFILGFIMLNLFIGLIIGFTLSVSFLFYGPTLDLSDIFNMVIAVATAIGTFIHYDSIKQHKLQRTWDMNKEHLLNLSKKLRDGIEFTRDMADYELAKKNSLESEFMDPKLEIEKMVHLSKSVKEFLDIFYPMLPNSLITEIKIYNKNYDAINKSYPLEHQDLIKIYEKHNDNQKRLSKTLATEIRKLSGTNK